MTSARAARVRAGWLRQRGFLAGLLSPRAADVLGARLGARTGVPETLASIAREFRISRERVRQLEGGAVERIQRANVALEIELREPEILVRLRVRDARSARRRPWRIRRELFRELGLDQARRRSSRAGSPSAAASLRLLRWS